VLADGRARRITQQRWATHTKASVCSEINVETECSIAVQSFGDGHSTTSTQSSFVPSPSIRAIVFDGTNGTPSAPMDRGNDQTDPSPNPLRSLATFMTSAAR
jgi:hypothetical protein